MLLGGKTEAPPPNFVLTSVQTADFDDVDWNAWRERVSSAARKEIRPTNLKELGVEVIPGEDKKALAERVTQKLADSFLFHPEVMKEVADLHSVGLVFYMDTD